MSKYYNNDLNKLKDSKINIRIAGDRRDFEIDKLKRKNKMLSNIIDDFTNKLNNIISNFDDNVSDKVLREQQNTILIRDLFLNIIFIENEKYEQEILNKGVK